MKKTGKSATGRRGDRPPAFLLEDQQGITESEPSFWGGDWATRFAAHFDCPLEASIDQTADEIGRAVKQAVNTLPGLERRIIIDYYVFCFSRQVIAVRQGLDEGEVDNARARAERQLRGILAEFVERKFGLPVTGNQQCPLCRSRLRAKIDDELARNHPQKPWGVLRRHINERFGLDIKRVQTVMTHWRYHRVVQLETSQQPSTREENRDGKDSSER